MLTKGAVGVLLCAVVLVAHSGTLSRRNIPAVKQKMFSVALPDESRGVNQASEQNTSEIVTIPALRPLGGFYTGIEGFFDFQVNAGACQYIRVDKSVPSGNSIHVIYMTDPDSTTDPAHPSRSTRYVYSTNGGLNWNSFSSLRVPDRRSGYPSLDMLQGVATQGTIIANHNDPGTGLSSYIYVDSPPGGGAFSELSPPGEPFGTDERIWPDVTGAADGSISISASRQTARTCFITRTTDFVSWASWTNLSPTGSAGLPMKSNTNGRVGCLHNTSFGTGEGVFFFESTNNGATWPVSGQLLFPANRIEGPDTFSFTLGSDFVYSGNNALVVVGEGNIGLNAPTDSAQITFWSQATGFKAAASKVNTPGVAVFENRATFNTTTLDMPSIGLSGNTIVVAYHAMMKGDTSLNGYNCSDIFLVQSDNGGLTWSTPRNLSNSPALDDRFVSVSPWNQPGYVNLVWQEDTEAGSNIIADPGATVQRTRQVFMKALLTGVDDERSIPESFSLGQNYPNPFNPTTVIDYTVAHAGSVSLKVYNLLGEEVAILVNENLQPGTYQATFNASTLPSGMYMYQLKAGLYTASGKMLLLK